MGAPPPLPDMPEPSLSRRRFLAAGAVAGAAATVGAGFGLGPFRRDGSAAADGLSGSEPFYGAHQAGIATAQQDRLLFAAYDLTTTRRSDVAVLLAQWTEAAARLTDGRDAVPPAASPFAPPSDTGEATGLDPAHLTLTFGFGPAAVLEATASTVSAWPGSARRPWPTCRPSPATTSTRPCRAATCASRPAPTTPRWPTTPSAT